MFDFLRNLTKSAEEKRQETVAAYLDEALQGRARPIYHNDHSRPERPVIRTLEDEIGRVIRSRV